MKARSIGLTGFKWGLAALLLSSLAGFSQNLHRLTFKGTLSTLDADGNEVTRPITDKTLIQEWAGRAGVSDLSNLTLAFHRNVDSRGDAIEIVDRKTGAHVTTVFPLFFPESASAQSSKGIVEKRFAYVYNLYQAEYSRGTALLNQQILINRKGQTNRFVSSGEMQWYQLPEGTNRLRICKGTFKVTKPIK